MTDHRNVPSKPMTSDEPKREGNPHGTEGHYSGEEFDASTFKRERETAVGASGGKHSIDPDAANHALGENIPPEAGRRAYIDSKTGEVHGSGSDAGGGSGDENYDAD